MTSSLSRSRNAKLNIIIGYVAQVGIIILSLVGRKIFLTFLSADYLGINGLYSNILTMLSLAELGVDSAVVYSLYKPVADNNKILVCGLINYFKKIYRYLAFAVLIIGGGLLPFIPFLVTSDMPKFELQIYYLFFLLNSVASYFVAHKIALLSALQKQRVLKLITLGSNIVLQGAQIITLIVFNSYYLYLLIMVLNTIVTNVVLGKIAENIYPLEIKGEGHVRFDKCAIKERIYSAALYKLGVVLINSTDNVLISVLVSTATVGYYSNYTIIILGFNSFISVITRSLIDGIGNLAAGDNNQKQSQLFDMLVLCYHFVGAVGFVGIFLLANNIIEFWLGAQYQLANQVVFAIALNYYLTTSISPIWMFREANGLFVNVRYLLLLRAAVNLILSIILGGLFGVLGVILGTILSLLLTSFWYEPLIISRKIFMRETYLYWGRQLKYFMVTLVSFFICYHIKECFGCTLFDILLSSMIICFIVSILFFSFNYSSKEFKNMKKYIM